MVADVMEFPEPEVGATVMDISETLTSKSEVNICSFSQAIVQCFVFVAFISKV